MSVKVVPSSIRKLDGPDRIYIVTWDYSSATGKKKWGSNLPDKDKKPTASATDHYIVKWQYRADDRKGKEVWFDGQDENVKSPKSSQYSPPEFADRIRVKIRPMAKEYKYKSTNSDGKKVEKTAKYFTSEYSTWKELKVNDTTNDPADIGGVSLELKNTTTNGITIKATVSGINPSDNIDKVEFRLYRGTSYVQENHVNVSMQTATWTFKQLTPGTKYRVGVRGINSATSEFSENRYLTDEFLTPPLVTKIQSIANDSPNSILITLQKSPTATSYLVRGTTDPDAITTNNDGAWAGPWELDKNFGVISLDTISEKWYFQAKAVNAGGESKWSSKFGYKGLSTKPSAPTTWSDTITSKTNENVTLFWAHNPTDGSAQRKAEVVYTGPSGSPVTVQVDNTKDEYGNWKNDTLSITISRTNSGVVRWKVRTRGLSNTWSDYSVERSINFYSEPQLGVHISSLVDRQLTQYPFSFEVYTSDEIQKVRSLQMSILSNDDYISVASSGGDLVSAGEAIWKYYIPVNDYQGTQFTIPFNLTPGDVIFQNNEEYDLVVLASYDSGLTVKRRTKFEVAWTGDYDVPEPETMGMATNPDDLSLTLWPVCRSIEEGTVGDDDIITYPDVMLSVYRMENDGSFILIQDNIENNPSGQPAIVIDPHPSLARQYYRIIAISNITGQSSYVDISEDLFDSKSIVLQWVEDTPKTAVEVSVDEISNENYINDGFIVRLPYNIELDESNDKDVALVNYIGRSHPVSYYGTQLGYSRNLKTEIVKDDYETIFALRKLMRYMGNVYVREPSGLGSWAQVNISMSNNYSSLTVPVTLTITPVEGGI